MADKSKLIDAEAKATKNLANLQQQLATATAALHLMRAGAAGVLVGFGGAFSTRRPGGSGRRCGR
jgi:hypothetical protein